MLSQITKLKFLLLKIMAINDIWYWLVIVSIIIIVIAIIIAVQKADVDSIIWIIGIFGFIILVIAAGFYLYTKVPQKPIPPIKSFEKII
uniref:Uncharacterized protein n=1 Tax=Pithovirus LCPAC104 TaxID=2506589 RepID=A0A481Z527_9VIRU|nr:MAG: hypothetical protein LCPAC104_00180 [Pithovirus LCPAC104]